MFPIFSSNLSQLILSRTFIFCVALVLSAPRFGWADTPNPNTDLPPALAAIQARKAENAALFAAVKKGDVATLEKMLQANPELIKSQEYWGQTLIIHALEQGEKGLSVVELLLKKGADINQANNSERTPLDFAIASGSEVLVRLLLDKGAKIENPKYPPLMSAISHYRPEILELLLKAGAEINTKNPKGQTALHISARYGQLKDLEFLIAHGADANARDNEGKPAIFDIAFSVMSNEIYRTAVEYLTAQGTPLDYRTKMGNSLLHQTILEHGISNARVNRVSVLLEKGLDANLTNRRGEIALHLALRSNSPADEILGDLIAKSNLDARDQHGLTPLLLALLYDLPKARDLIVAKRAPAGEIEQVFDAAAQNDGTKLKRLLVVHPLLAQVRLSDGSTALHLAALWAALDSIKILVEAGADPNARDGQARTPLHRAIRSHSNPLKQSDARQVVKALLNRGANAGVLDENDTTPLHEAARLGLQEEGTFLASAMVEQRVPLDLKNKKGDTPLSSVLEAKSKERTALARLLLEKGSDPNSENKSGTSLLTRAAMTNNAELMGLLLEKGAPLPPETPDSSLFGTAVVNNAREAVIFLLERGVNINNPSNPTSPLERALWYDYDEMARLLIERGIDVNDRHQERETPLTQAVRRNKKEIVALLLEKKADPNLPNRDGAKPLELANGDSFKPIADLLRQYGAK